MDPEVTKKNLAETPYPVPVQSWPHVEHFASLGVNEMDVLQEECAELIQAISKLRRVSEKTMAGESLPENYDKALDKVAEEMGDVYLALNSTRFQLHIPAQAIQLKMNQKMIRYLIEPHGCEIRIPEVET